MLFLIAAIGLFGLYILYLDDPYKAFLDATFPALPPAMFKLLNFLPAIPSVALCLFGLRAVQVDVRRQQEAHQLASQLSWDKFSHGASTMPTAFWRWHVPTCLISACVVIFVMADYLRLGTWRAYAFLGFLLLVGIAAQLFTLHGVWRCSRHDAGPRSWRMLTRVGAILLTAAVVALLIVYSAVAVTGREKSRASSAEMTAPGFVRTAIPTHPAA